MLQKNEMVKFENAIKGFFNSVCNVYEYRESVLDNVTSFSPVLVKEGIPCRRGYSIGGAVNYVKTGEMKFDNSEIKQYIKLFMPKGTDIKPGSLVKVVYGDFDEYYEYSGYGLFYDSHTEVLLKSVERWA